MEAIGRLAGGVAHDFNNLLTVILGYASHLEHELQPDDPVAIQATEIRGAAERAARLTQQLLAFSRQQVLQPRVVDLNETVANLTSMLQRLIGSHVRLEMQLEEGLWSVLVDPGQIEQVLMNLVVNARDAMPRGGAITIRTSTEKIAAQRLQQGVPIPTGDWVAIEVADTGEGMPAAIVSRIFEPFFTTKALGQGTGLGLSMVYGIVKQSGGFIFCNSAPGQGTTMRVYLPRAQAAVEQSAPGVTVGTARGGTILVVEDEPAVRGLLSAVLQKAGYTLHEAASGADALAELERIPTLDLLITDVIMPEMTGVEVARRVVQLRPGTPVLYMSGYADEVLQHEDVVAGSSFLQKPFRPDVLMSKVRDIVEGVGAIRA
jgi:CheY-like chemotaxis protein